MHGFLRISKPKKSIFDKGYLPKYREFKPDIFGIALVYVSEQLVSI